MPHVDVTHPGLYELLEWVSGRAEVFDPSRTGDHVHGGCARCAADAEMLRGLGRALGDDEEYASFFEGTPGIGVAADPPPGSAVSAALATHDGTFPAAQALLSAMEEGAESFREALPPLQGSPVRRRAVLHAAQLAARLVPRDPAGMLEVARVLDEEAGEDPAVAAEAALLEAQALTSLGRTAEARKAAGRARGAFRRGENPFHEALCDYFEGSAASFGGDYPGAEALLRRAARAFGEFGQPSWEGRSLAALATCVSQRGDDAGARPLWGAALALLDPSLDANAYVQTLINQASSIARLGEPGEAKKLYARALSMTLRHGASHQTHMIRVGLAEIEFRRGDFPQALGSFRKLAVAARTLRLEEDVVLARLYEAECLGRLGREDEMCTVVASLRGSAGAAADPALSDLFACLDAGDLAAGAVAHVRGFLERASDPAAYVPIARRRAGR